MSLREKVVNSGTWNAGGKFVQLLSSLLITTILAKLLSPDDFGLIGIATVYIGLITEVTTIGFGSAIIPELKTSQIQLSSLFWLNFATNTFAFLLIFFISSFLAAFNNVQTLEPLLQLVSIKILLSTLHRMHRKLLEKELQFKSLAKIDIAAAIISGLSGITMAFTGFGVFSLAGQALTLEIVYIIFTRIYCKWIPGFHFSLPEIRPIIKFALQMKGSRIVQYFSRNIDFILLSKLLDVTSFGLYSFAYRIMYFPVKQISYVFIEILFPAFSKIQDTPVKIREGYLRSLHFLALITAPLMTAIALFATPIISMLWGEKWIGLSGVLPIFAFIGLVQSLDFIANAVFPALKRADILLRVLFIRTLLVVIALFSGARYGLQGIAAAILVAVFWGAAVSQFYLKKVISMKITDVFYHLAGPLAGSSCMILYYYSASHFFPENTTTGPYGLMTCVFIIYGAIIWIYDRKKVNFVWESFMKSRSSGGSNGTISNLLQRSSWRYIWENGLFY